MKNYFYLAKNSGGILKSGIVSASSCFAAYAQAQSKVTKWSDDQFVIVKLEVIE